MREPRFEERSFFDERGFTLAELVASIAILGVLAAIAVVVLFGVLEQRRVDAAATQFASDLRLAHTSASNQLTDWRVVFMPDGSSLSGCGEAAGVDYCMVKLEVPYTGRPGSAAPRAVEFEPRYFPEGTKIKRINFEIDCSAGGAGAVVAPSVCGRTGSLEFNSDGTARTLRPGVSASLVIGSDDGTPSHRISFRAPTSRVRIERNFP
jgi:prepilin-type N-terminal cleavage/methylation domain-containing protein